MKENRLLFHNSFDASVIRSLLLHSLLIVHSQMFQVAFLFFFNNDCDRFGFYLCWL